MTAPDPQVGVVVTLQMIYETVRGVEQTVQRIDTTLSEVVKDQADHEQRIRDLENDRVSNGKLTGKLAGIAATLGVVGGGLFTFLLSQIGG